MQELSVLVEAAGKKGLSLPDWQTKQATDSDKAKAKPKPGLSPERVEQIKSILAKLDFGFKKSKSDFALVDELELTPEDLKELAPYIHVSKKLAGKRIIFAKAIPVWLSKAKALETMFLPGVGGGVFPGREIRGKMAGATPAEVRAGGSPLREPEREFEGGPYGPAKHLRPAKRGQLTAPWGKKESTDTLDLLNQLLYEAELAKLDSQTATMLRDQLSNVDAFALFDDDGWVQFGKWAKKTRLTKSVFTGALAEFLVYLTRVPKGLPMTTAYADKEVMRSGSPVKLKNASGAYILAVLESDNLLEKLQSTAKESLKAMHTDADEKLAKTSPQKNVDLWWPSDDLKELVGFLKKKKVTIKVETSELCENEIPSFESDLFQELFG